MVPSACRAVEPCGRWEFLSPKVVKTTYHKPALESFLYDVLRRDIGSLVVDADGCMTDWDSLRQLRMKHGLGPSQIDFSGSIATQGDWESIHPMPYASYSTLINSLGPDPAYEATKLALMVEKAYWD